MPKANWKFEKIVLVPCKLDGDGKVITTDAHQPYGYHHALGVYADKSHSLLLTIDSSVSLERATEIAKIVAEDTPLEVHPDYYHKLRSEGLM